MTSSCHFKFKSRESYFVRKVYLLWDFAHWQSTTLILSHILVSRSSIYSSISFYSILFADDTTLFKSSKNWHELSIVVNSILNTAIEWWSTDWLSLNKFYHIRPKERKKCPTIHITGSSVIEVGNAKFVGIIMIEFDRTYWMLFKKNRKRSWHYHKSA